MPVGKNQIRNRWGYHPPADLVAANRHEQVRETFIAFADFLDAILPDGRAKSAAFTKLQESSMWANYSIAETSPVVMPKPTPVVEPVTEPKLYVGQSE